MENTTSSNYMEFNVSFRKTFIVCHDVGVPAMVWVTSAFGTVTLRPMTKTVLSTNIWGECRKHSKYS